MYFQLKLLYTEISVSRATKIANNVYEKIKERNQQIMMINVEELKPHPRNNEFFDDMSGEKWSEFLSSVKMRGIIEPIVITKDKMIVSGHQRVRACKELGIDNIFLPRL